MYACMYVGASFGAPSFPDPLTTMAQAEDCWSNGGVFSGAHASHVLVSLFLCNTSSCSTSDVGRVFLADTTMP